MSRLAVTAAAIRRAHPVRVATLFGFAALGVLTLAYLLVHMLGLPDWAFAGAVGLAAAGLPIILWTGVIERRRAIVKGGAFRLKKSSDEKWVLRCGQFGRARFTCIVSGHEVEPGCLKGRAINWARSVVAVITFARAVSAVDCVQLAPGFEMQAGVLFDQRARETGHDQQRRLRVRFRVRGFCQAKNVAREFQ